MQFRAAFQRFMARFSEGFQGVVAIDGKLLRRSFDHASARSPLHMVSAWGCEQRLVLAQIATDVKSNEITAVPKLLEMLSLKGTIVTTDALNCQRAIAQQILDQGSDYVLALKGNQGTLEDDVSTYLDDPASKVTVSKPTVDADHGRIATRTATVSTDIDWLQDDHHWSGLAAIGKVVRVRETAAKTTAETAYYLLSTALSAERFNAVGRRKPPALAAGCRDERGSGQEPFGQWPAIPSRAATHGDERYAEGRQQGVLAGQAQASRMG
jgi:predicted transposase YbfD/YdcC